MSERPNAETAQDKFRLRDRVRLTEASGWWNADFWQVIR